MTYKGWCAIKSNKTISVGFQLEFSCWTREQAITQYILCTTFISEKVHNVTFPWAQGPKILGGKGKGAKMVFFYVALASHSHRQQPFFFFFQSFHTISSFIHQPRHNHQNASFAPWKPYLKPDEMKYVQQMKGWWGIGEKKAPE